MSIPLVREITKDRYNLGAVKWWVRTAADYYGIKYGIKHIGGYRDHGSVSGSLHPLGRAIDLSVSAKTDKAKGDKIAADAIANRLQFGITQVIWNRRIWTEGRGWHAYVGPSDHTDHVHLSFADHPGTGSAEADVQRILDGSVGQIVDEEVDPLCAWNLKLPVAGQVCILTKVQVRQGMGLASAGAGAFVMLLGVVLLVAYSLGKSGVASAVPGAGRVISSTLGRR